MTNLAYLGVKVPFRSVNFTSVPLSLMAQIPVTDKRSQEHIKVCNLVLIQNKVDLMPQGEESSALS